MDVKLAGFNLDCDIMDELNAAAGPRILTPETFSAAYARISRSAKDVTLLRRDACCDVEKARNSNQHIIFEMGHHSVAEHAVFNFDIMGVSRLALEELEKFRLISYTEKSQRYVTQSGDFVVPEELLATKERDLFLDTLGRQNTFYFQAFAALKEYTFARHRRLAENAANHRLLEGWAKEDARYVLPLATVGQVGMTINARNLEHLFRRFSISALAEVRELGRRMYDLIKDVAPSIILFPQASDFEKDAGRELRAALAKRCRYPLPSAEAGPVLVDYTPAADERILAAFLTANGRTGYRSALKLIRRWSEAEKRSIFKFFFQTLNFYDHVPREFELVHFTFQTMLSASAFAQLKRHRMATLLAGDYDPDLGNTIPSSFAATDLKGEFLKIIRQSNRTYRALQPSLGAVAAYVLTNSHRRPIMMKMNLREFYHFVRLRDDEHAQWDIRRLTAQLIRLVRPLMPSAGMLLCGKSRFAQTYENIYKKKPRFLI